MEDKLYYYKLDKATISVYDGDSITADPKLGYRVKGDRTKYRLIGIDTPEIRTKNLVEKAAGYKARDWLREQIANGDEIIVHSVKAGKYGRWLCIVYIDGRNINEELLSLGLAEPYLK